MVEVMHPREALATMLDSTCVLQGETVFLREAVGRVLACDVVADRDSPACDVSAMDGFAVHVADVLEHGVTGLPVRGEVAMGCEPEALKPGSAMRIFTGGGLPSGADAVVQCEWVEVRDEVLRLTQPMERVAVGMHIRRRGENVRGGDRVLSAGRVIDAATVGALANHGHVAVDVTRRVRVGVITTGSEVVDVASTPKPWAVRNSNGPVLHARVTGCEAATLAFVTHVSEDARALRDVLEAALGVCDMVWITGGVSVGDHDNVPSVVRDLGGEVAFHRLSIRPGKPMLGAMMPGGKPLLGMPGNPVSTLTMSKIFGMPLLRKLAGCSRVHEAGQRVNVAGYAGKDVGLWWYRSVRWVEENVVELVSSMGSGDVGSAARADGFIEVPPNTTALNEARFWSWI